MKIFIRNNCHEVIINMEEHILSAIMSINPNKDKLFGDLEY